MIRILKESETKREAIFAREDPVANVEEPVRAIIEEVRKHGDEALKRYTKEFDGADIPTVEVGMGSVEDGFRQADPVLVEILFRAVDRIAAFHQHQLRNSFIVNNEDGIILGQKVLPLERVGIYVPGGTAAYPSSVLMNAIPAKIAGVKEICMVTPPGKDGKIPPKGLRRGQGVPGGRGPGHRRPGLRHGERPQGGQDRGPRQPVRGGGQEAGLR